MHSPSSMPSQAWSTQVEASQGKRHSVNAPVVELFPRFMSIAAAVLAIAWPTTAGA
jgi:hypothetical protein